jgi:hypothetical protein
MLPVTLPFFPPGEGALAGKADFLGEMLFFEAVHG